MKVYLKLIYVFKLSVYPFFALIQKEESILVFVCVFSSFAHSSMVVAGAIFTLLHTKGSVIMAFAVCSINLFLKTMSFQNSQYFRSKSKL